MGQARLRSTEIAQLKAAGPRQRVVNFLSKRVTAFGAFYHDDAADGVGVFLSEDSEPNSGWTNLTFHTLATLAAQEYHRWRDSDTVAQEQMVNEAWAQLHESRELYNRNIFGSTRRDLNAQPHNVVLTETLIEIFVKIIANIWLLEMLGHISNDDYNGLVIHYRD